jgi:hypothetical protein
MISDVLSDMYDQIRAYLDDPLWDDVYSGTLRAEIERVLGEIDRLRAKIDSIRPDAPSPEGS